MMKRTVDIEIQPTLEEIAEQIWLLDSGEQVKMLGWLVTHCKYYQILMQIEYIADELNKSENEDMKIKIKELIHELEIRINPERIDY